MVFNHREGENKIKPAPAKERWPEVEVTLFIYGKQLKRWACLNNNEDFQITKKNDKLSMMAIM